MLTDIQRQRMQLAKSTKSGESNCVGTTLYVLGVLDKDNYATRKFAENYLESITRIPEAEEGAILVLRNWNSLEHFGIVVNQNPVRIYHRPGREPIELSEPLEDVLKRFSSCNLLEFYISE